MDIKGTAQQFDEDGFVIVRGLFTAQELATIEENLEQFIRDVVPGLGPGDVYYEDSPTKPIKSVFRLHERSEFFKQLVAEERVMALVSAVLPRGEPEPEGAMLFGKPAKDGSVTPIHQDNAFQNWTPPDALTVTIALDESTPANGVLVCLKGSHKVGVLPHLPSGVLGFSQTLAEPVDTAQYPEVQLCMQPGDVALHHTNTIHRSGPNQTERPRRQLGIGYISSLCRKDAEGWERYQRELKKLHDQHAKSP